jgi:putative DNA primase/helicase
VLPDLELQKFLQRYMGYCLTGFTTEQAFVFCYGTGANGKGTFINTIVKVFGDYAKTATMDTFIASHNDHHLTELANLHGARLVTAQETERNRRWNETRIKALTGGDKVSARFMHQDLFEFDPVCKLLLNGNNLPRLSEVDDAMRRRMLVMPFLVAIPKEEQDPDLIYKLEPEHPAILRWCIDGAIAWQQNRLAPPASVIAATTEYFIDQDILGQWLEECTAKDPLADTRLEDLFASWKSWCEKNGHARKSGFPPGSSRSLSTALKKNKAFAGKREPRTGKALIIGLSLNPSWTNPDDDDR